MRIQREFTYPADVETVFAMMTDEAFQAAKCSATEPLEHSESVTGPAEARIVSTSRTMSTDRFPDFVKGFVRSSMAVTEQISYAAPGPDGARTGALRLRVDGLPMTMAGTVRIEPSPGSPQTTTVRIDGDLKAKVPLLGGKIEQTAAPVIVDAIKAEHRVGTTWLADR